MIKKNSSSNSPSIFKRFLAYVIDTIILLPSFVGAGFLVGFVIGLVRTIGTSVQILTPDETLYIKLTGSAVGLLIFIFYYSILESSHWQASVGKKLLKLYVATKDNKRLKFWSAFFRTLVYGILSSLPMLLRGGSNLIAGESIASASLTSTHFTLLSFAIFLVGLIPIYSSVFFTKEKKTLYDMITGTRVYKAKN